MEDIEIEDGSNDKAYFTMVPNIVLNHSSAVDQALYMQMKRFAGEKSGGGFCTASKRTLMTKLGVGLKALNTSIEYLVEHKWISTAGTRKVMTDGGLQEIQMFRVNDIWKMNTEHYKGVLKSTPLVDEGVAESSQGVLESRQGVSESTPTKNYIKLIDTPDAEAPEDDLVYEDENAPRKKVKRVDAHILEVFAVIGGSKYPGFWVKRVPYRDAAEWLYKEKGIEQINKAMSFARENRGTPFFSSIHTPVDLQDKWEKLLDSKERKGL